MTTDGMCPECGEYIGDVDTDNSTIAFCPNCGADLSDYEDEELEPDE